MGSKNAAEAYTWEINIKMNSPGNPYLNIQSPSHDIIFVKKEATMAEIKLKEGTIHHPDKNFVL